MILRIYFALLFLSVLSGSTANSSPTLTVPRINKRVYCSETVSRDGYISWFRSTKVGQLQATQGFTTVGYWFTSTSTITFTDAQVTKTMPALATTHESGSKAFPTSGNFFFQEGGTDWPDYFDASLGTIRTTCCIPQCLIDAGLNATKVSYVWDTIWSVYWPYIIGNSASNVKSLWDYRGYMGGTASLSPTATPVAISIQEMFSLPVPNSPNNAKCFEIYAPSFDEARYEGGKFVWDVGNGIEPIPMQYCGLRMMTPRTTTTTTRSTTSSTSTKSTSSSSKSTSTSTKSTSSSSKSSSTTSKSTTTSSSSSTPTTITTSTSSSSSTPTTMTTSTSTSETTMTTSTSSSETTVTTSTESTSSSSTTSSSTSTSTSSSKSSESTSSTTFSSSTSSSTSISTTSSSTTSSYTTTTSLTTSSTSSLSTTSSTSQSSSNSTSSQTSTTSSRLTTTSKSSTKSSSTSSTKTTSTPVTADFIENVIIQGTVRKDVNVTDLLVPQNLIPDKSNNGSSSTDIDTNVVQDLQVSSPEVTLGTSSRFQFIVNVQRNVSNFDTPVTSPSDIVTAVFVQEFSLNLQKVITNFKPNQPLYNQWQTQPFDIVLSVIDDSTVQILAMTQVVAPRPGVYNAKLKLRVIVPNSSSNITKRDSARYVYEDLDSNVPFVVVGTSSSKTTRTSKTTLVRSSKKTVIQVVTTLPQETTTTEPPPFIEDPTSTTLEPFQTTSEVVIDVTTLPPESTSNQEVILEKTTVKITPLVKSTIKTTSLVQSTTLVKSSTKTTTIPEDSTIPEDTTLPNDTTIQETPTEDAPESQDANQAPEEDPVIAPDEPTDETTNQPIATKPTIVQTTSNPELAGQDDTSTVPDNLEPTDDTLPGVQAVSSQKPTSKTTSRSSSKSTINSSMKTTTKSTKPSSTTSTSTIAQVSISSVPTYNYALPMLQNPSTRDFFTKGMAGSSMAAIAISVFGAIAASVNPSIQLPQSTITLVTTIQGIAGLGLINVDQSGLMQDTATNLVWTLGMLPIPNLSQSVLNSMGGQVPVKKGSIVLRRRQDSTNLSDDSENFTDITSNDSSNESSNNSAVCSIEVVAARAGIPDYAIFITVFVIFLIVMSISGFILGSMILFVHLTKKKQDPKSTLYQKLSKQQETLGAMTIMTLSRLWIIFFSPLMLVIAYQWYYASTYEGVPIVMTVMASITFILFILGVPCLVFYRMRFGIGSKKELHEMEHHRKTLGAFYERYSPAHWITILFFIPSILVEMIASLSDGGFFWNPYVQLGLMLFSQLFLVGLFWYRRPLMGKMEALVWLIAKLLLFLGLILMIPMLPNFNISDESSEILNMTQLILQGLGLGFAMLSILIAVFWPTIKKIYKNKQIKKAKAQGVQFVEELDEEDRMHQAWEDEVRQEMLQHDRRHRTTTGQERDRTITGQSGGIMQSATDWVIGVYDNHSDTASISSRGASTIASEVALHVNDGTMDWRLERTMIRERAGEEMWDGLFPLLFSILLFVGNFLGPA